ncbi:MAG TPA: glucose 1-dehydrogenase [Elusimicrobiota bacterium]|nr:glucose 1-dehydrogenase [Elusimicrobiota bacterium]
MAKKKLEGKTAVVTGATSGLALASAKRFAEEGARVIITGRRADVLEKAVKEIGPNAVGVRGDSASLADLDKLFAEVKKRGRIDVLFASAGIAEMNFPLGSVSEEHFDKTFDLNVRGTLFTVQKALPLLNDGASVILTGSIAGVKGFEGMSVYNASKAAIRSFARSWANELKGRKIRVNVIAPGPIDTAAVAGLPQQMKDAFASMVPLGRWGRAEEIAGPALFLASDDSTFVTGIELTVDGGMAQV